MAGRRAEMMGPVYRRLLCLLRLWAWLALAEQLLLLNGDRLSGEVVREQQGQLKLKTAYAGTLNIDL